MQSATMDCGTTFIKYILFLFNLIFACSGIVLIATGSYIIGNVKDFKSFTDGRIIAPPVVLIVAGVIVFIVAFLGCFGAIKENYSLLMAFAVALVVIFIIELAVGIAGAVLKNDFEHAMRKSMRKSMDTFVKADQVAWDGIHKTFKCCGIDSPADWSQSSVTRGLSATTLPNSCCLNPQFENSCQSTIVEGQDSPYKQGCWASIASKMKSSASILIGVGIGIAVIEVIGIIFACCLAMTIKKESRAK